MIARKGLKDPSDNGVLEIAFHYLEKDAHEESEAHDKLIALHSVPSRLTMDIRLSWTSSLFETKRNG